LGIAVVAAAASVIALTGCGSGSAPGAASGSGSRPSASASASSSAGAGVSTVATAQRTPECKSSELRVSYTGNAAIRNGALHGMSKADSVVTFTNVGGSTCVIQGYPGAAALGAKGVQVEQAKRSGQAVHPVFLRPGATASALIAADTASCDAPVAVPGLLVTAPDQYASTRLGSAGELCLHSLTVSPVVPGDAAGMVF
jgi:hypothetical protein